MKFEEILDKGKKIVEKYNFSAYIDTLLDYWEKKPPIPGHGFWHVLQVGVESFELGELNNYQKPDHLFLGGLFHDIYRPAEGKNGEEDQTYGAVVVEKLFKERELSEDAGKVIVSSIRSHDSWRDSDSPPQFDLLLSLGDKASHRLLLTDSFVWINNRKMELASRPFIYNSHLETLSSFYKYQLRAWQIFMKYNLTIGIERPIKAYLDIVSGTIDNLRNDPKSENFFKYVEKQKNKALHLEIKYLNAFGRSEESVNKITEQYVL